MGAGKYKNKHGVGILLNKKWRQKNHRYWVTQRADHNNKEKGKPSTHHADERVLSPLGVCWSTHRENVQNNRKTHESQYEEHTNCGRRLQCRIGPTLRSRTSQCCSAHTQRGEQKKRLDEATDDDTELHSTQHDLQKNAWKASYLQITWRTEKHIDYVLIKRRHLIYSKGAEANDMIHMGSDHRCVMATFVINAHEKNGSRDANSDKQRQIAKEIDNKDGNKEASTFEERSQELEEKINKKLQPQLRSETKWWRKNLRDDGSWSRKRKRYDSSSLGGESWSSDRNKRDQETNANTAAAREKPLTVRCNAHSQRSKNEETLGNDNRTQSKTERNSETTVTRDERPGHLILAHDVIDPCDFSSTTMLEVAGRSSPSQVRHGCWKIGWQRDRERRTQARHGCGEDCERERRSPSQVRRAASKHEKKSKDRAAAAKTILEENDEVTSEHVNIRRLIEERRNTAREKKHHLREVSKQIRKCIRDKQRSKMQEKIQRIFEEFRGIKNISAKWRYQWRNTFDHWWRNSVRNQQAQGRQSQRDNGLAAEDIKTWCFVTKEMIEQIFDEVLKQESCTLPALYKLFSTILYNRLYPKLEQIQPEDQGGFWRTYQALDHCQNVDCDDWPHEGVRLH